MSVMEATCGAKAQSGTAERGGSVVHEKGNKAMHSISERSMDFKLRVEERRKTGEW